MDSNLRPPQKLIEAMMAEVLACPEASRKTIDASVRKHLSGTKYRFPKASELVAAFRKLSADGQRNTQVERLLRCKAVRTDSGIAPITVLTKPFPCPGKCVYCPREARMPKSYVATEPAAARALSLKFDPYQQVKRRLQTLEGNGHTCEKIELIVKGGTWSAYPWVYRRWFIKRCFDAANHLGGKVSRRFASLDDSQRANETAGHRIIGLTIETRPDWITVEEIVRLRELGATRVELGVQTLDDRIFKLTKRGHTVADVVRATALLKAAGFKVDYHFVPGQPGSSVKKDIAMFAQLFSDARFRPDMVKIYPCVVIASAELADWQRRGDFKPLSGEKLINLLVELKTLVPYYCRLPRVVRDFPAFEISGGNKVSNLRDVVKERMRERGLSCHCLRCREAGHQKTLPAKTKLKLFVDRYENAGGTEYFLSLENPTRTTCLSFLRLRLPEPEPVILKALPELQGCAIIRELHTYGQALTIDDTRRQAVQHTGLGRRLMEEAEKIARKNGYKKLAVISGVGVRAYYRKIGFHLQGSYLVKKI